MMELNNEMKFDEAFAALEETIGALEASELPLEEAIALYERAGRLVVYCRRVLTNAQIKITDINERIAEMKDSGEPLFED